MRRCAIVTDGRRAGRSQPSMSDVARHAGVALGTVSNTLNSPEKVSETTRRRVLASIAELGFVRNDAARSLAAGTSTTVGLVVADIGNSFFVDIARGAESTLRQHGMNLLIANSDVDISKQVRNLEIFEQLRVAGVLLAPLDFGQVREGGRSLTRNTPLVLVNYASRNLAYSGVLVDERRGDYLAARHLIDNGRTRLAFIGGPLMLTAIAERYEGAQRAAAETGGVSLELVETRGLNIRHGRQIGRSLVEGGPRPFDGIVAGADLLAIGLIQVFDDSPGWSVPLDVAVTGYDNNHFASESAIPVTTISQPGEEMGRAAAELLMSEIAGSGDDGKQTVVLEPHLVPRRSTLGDSWRRD